MNINTLLRQSDIVPSDRLSVPVTIIGCGAIGSFAALALAKMGMKHITLYDHDKVDEVNLSNQFFPFMAVGMNKAEATARMLKDFADLECTAHHRKYEATDAPTTQGIVILAVDTMEARAEIFSWLHTTAPRVQYVIDPRMAAEYFELHTVNPHQESERERYMKVMHKEEDTVAQRCTAKSTIYTAMLSAGAVAKAVKNIIVKEDHPRLMMWDTKSSQQPLFQMYGNK